LGVPKNPEVAVYSSDVGRLVELAGL
jgi:hypothetical protein